MIRRVSRFDAILSSIDSTAFYLSLSFLIGYTLYPYFYYVKNEVLIVISVVGAWRYSFQIINYIRAIYYRYFMYPRIKKKINSLSEEEKYPEHIYFLIPSYKEEPWVSIEMMQSVLSDLNNIPSSATLVVSTGSNKDDAVLNAVFQSHPANEKVDILFQRQSEGKRIAMGHALRAISRDYHKRGLYEDNSIVVFMDGDSYLEPGVLSKTIPVFSAFSDIGAVTTNEVAYIYSDSKWYKDWFNLKFGQRHILFQSHSVGKKVMTLTGRFSVFRTHLCVNDEFINMTENDILTDSNFGRFRFLMGDDKTSWFYLFKNGWNMLYIPDALIYSLESRDAPFLEVSTSLPFRWYGNTLRNNNRASKITNNIPLFIRYVIRDQIYNMWTSLVGIVSALILTIFINPIYLPMYIAWVLFVRVIQQNVIAFMGYPVTMYTIPLMLYSQWVGSIIKIKSYHHLNVQKWSKAGGTVQESKDIGEIDHFLFYPMRKIRMYISYMIFLFALVVTSNAFFIPDVKIIEKADTLNNYIYADIKTDDNIDDSYKLNTIIANAPDNIDIILPRGVINIDNPIVINRSNIRILGRDTEIVYSMSNKEAVFTIMGRRSENIFYMNYKDINKTDIFQKGEYYLIQEENSKDFIENRLGSKVWYKEYPYIRQEIVKVNDIVLNKVIFEHKIETEFSDKIKITKLDMLKNIVIKSIKFRGDVDTSKYTNIYKNIDLSKSASVMKIGFAKDISLYGLDFFNSYSHSVDLDYIYNIKVERVRVEGALNKGKDGNGYFKISRTYHSSFKALYIKNIRHFTIQWSSAYNTISGISLYNTDINFHGGGSHHNRVINVYSDVNVSKHKWGSVFYTPRDAQWAPPDYDNNEVTF